MYLVKLHFCLGVRLGARLLDYMAALFLIFEEPPYYSHNIAAIHVPINSTQGFPFLHTLSSIRYL